MTWKLSLLTVIKVSAMKCPKCNKEMTIMCRPEATLLPNDIERVEVLGTCRDCDFDATWMIDTYSSGEVKEYGLQQYFFG